MADDLNHILNSHDRRLRNLETRNKTVSTTGGGGSVQGIGPQGIQGEKGAW